MPRPSKPLISRRNAAEAALRIVDEQGLDNLSLTRVAARLGVKPPSLYHHFHDKHEILAEVARLLLVQVPAMRPGDGSLDDRIVALCVATRGAILRHPNAAPLMLQFFPRHVLLAAYDGSAKVYDYPDRYTLLVLEGTEKLTFGSALFAAAAIARGSPAMPPVDAEKLPYLAHALASNPFDEDALFAETLRTYLAGVRARVRHEARAAAPP